MNRRNEIYHRPYIVLRLRCELVSLVWSLKKDYFFWPINWNTLSISVSKCVSVFQSPATLYSSKAKLSRSGGVASDHIKNLLWMVELTGIRTVRAKSCWSWLMSANVCSRPVPKTRCKRFICIYLCTIGNR